jgi:heat shock protein HtpX
VERRGADHRRPRSADEAWIVETVRKFADKAGIGMPEVGIFEGDPNAFATGAFKNSAWWPCPPACCRT